MSAQPGATITIQVQAQVVWACGYTKRGTVVASCDPLGLTVEADNQGALYSVISEAQHVLLVDLLEDGELTKFLQDHGWKANRAIPSTIPEGGVKFDVPFRLEPAAHGHP